VRQVRDGYANRLTRQLTSYLQVRLDHRVKLQHFSPLSLDRVTCSVADADLCAQLLEAHAPKCLGEHVSELLLRGDVLDDNAIPVVALPDVVVTSVYVCGAIMVNGILTE
jgi:hypothetical protein